MYIYGVYVQYIYLERERKLHIIYIYHTHTPSPKNMVGRLQMWTPQIESADPR